jgi:hypothetical protein
VTLDDGSLAGSVPVLFLQVKRVIVALSGTGGTEISSYQVVLLFLFVRAYARVYRGIPVWLITWVFRSLWSLWGGGLRL